jgi:DNA-binding LacI/PurR family transcriptional regulator
MTGKRTGRDARATLRDVGREAGVDPSLVSRVINDDPKAYATTETRKRILAAIRLLDYKPNASARGLKLARTSTIGVLLPDLTNPMNEAIIKGIQEKALELGYGVVIGNHAEVGVDRAFASLLLQGQADGLITLGHEMTDKTLRLISESNDGRILPVNGRIPGISSSVNLNDARGSEIAVEHLAKLGHKRIIGIFAPLRFDTAKRRQEGFKNACRRFGIEPIAVEAEGYTYQDGFNSATEGITDFKPTAIYASSLVIAIGTLKALKSQNFRVPEDVSVIALHDAEIANFTSPPLTTISLPASQMGSDAVVRIVDLISGGKPMHHVIDKKPILIKRESTAVPTKN